MDQLCLRVAEFTACSGTSLQAFMKEYHLSSWETDKCSGKGLHQSQREPPRILSTPFLHGSPAESELPGRQPLLSHELHPLPSLAEGTGGGLSMREVSQSDFLPWEHQVKNMKIAECIELFRKRILRWNRL